MDRFSAEIESYSGKPAKNALPCSCQVHFRYAVFEKSSTMTRAFGSDGEVILFHDLLGFCSPSGEQAGIGVLAQSWDEISSPTAPH